MEFRIAVNLNAFFKDERQLCYIFLEENKFDTISDLENHLREMFDISGGFSLVVVDEVDQYLLPGPENIRILKPNDHIKAVVSSFKLKIKRIPTKCEPNDADTEAIKDQCDPLDKCDKNLKKKKKKKSKRTSQDDEDVNKFDEEAEGLASEIVEEESTSKANEKDTTMESLPCELVASFKKDLSGEETNDNSDQEDMPLDVAGLENMIIKRIEELKKSSLVTGDKLKLVNDTNSGRIVKRKRIRKRKKSNNLIQNIMPDAKNVMPNTSLLLMQSQKAANHIRFDEGDKSVVQNGLNTRTHDKPRIVHAIESLSTNGYHNSDKIKEKENCESKPNESNFSFDEIMSNLNKYETINSLPSKGVIIFKMLTMGDNYLPKISGYILGRILKACQETSILSLNILDGHKEAHQPTGKFDLEEKNSFNLDMVEVEWNQVVDARLIYS